MRLLELHLDRFGCFTDRRIAFRPDAALTVIYGPNEAGKSTALAALADVLYGIEARSPFDFLHRYADMRLGATIVGKDGKHFGFRRRKGNQNTLLDDGEAPLAEDALAGFLGSVDRTLFLDAFGLNRDRLRAGAQRLIDGGGRVGESLLAAAPGLSSLMALRSQLAAEAEQLFPAGRKVSSRPFWQACERHSDARKRVRLEILQADTVRLARTGLDEAAETVNQLRQDQRTLRKEASRLARLKNALPRLGCIDDLESARENLGVLPDVAADFPARCRTALDARRTIALDIQRLDQEIAEARTKLEAVGVDDTLLAQADAVERLADQRAAVVKAAEDLPKREGELAAIHQQIDAHARRLGLADRGALLARRPPDAAVARARSLLGERRRLRDQGSERRATLAKVVAELDDLARKRDALGHIADPAPLRRQLDGLAGLPQRIETRDELARNLAVRQADIDDRLARLVVPVTSADDLARLPVPDVASVELAVERFDGLEKRRGECEAERRRLTAQAAQVERRIGEYIADGEGLDPEALNVARGERDALWQTLRPRLLGEPLPPASPSDVADYEFAVVHADQTADRRQAQADRVAGYRVLVGEQGEIKLQLAAIEQALADVESGTGQANADWAALWSPSQLTPQPPREMRGWLQARSDILRLLETLRAEQTRLAEVGRHLGETTGRLDALARALGLEAVPPADRLKAAAAAVGAMETTFQNARSIADQREGCERRQRELQAALDQLDGDEAQWRGTWAEPAGAIGLREDALDEEADAALGTWQAVPALEASMKDLEHRIGRIRQDWRAFETAAKDMRTAVAPDLGDTDPVAVSAVLRTRLVEARQAATSRAGLRATLAGLEDKAEACRRREQLNDSELAGLCEAAGAEDRDALGALAGCIEQSANLAEQLAGERKALLDAADGFSESALRADLAGRDPDSLKARLQELEDAEKSLEGQLGSAISTETLAAKTLADLEARAGAAAAAQDEQNALADVAGIIETWTGIAAAEKLLSAAIEAYRAQHQNPLLDRVSEAFAVATGNNFLGISLDFDDADSQRIVAVRADGERLGVDALSEGTADQLFLALRIATIEDHARRAQPLPFVADDLFVTFDDTRTKAGLTLLAELGRTTQTIVFTHHQHVVEAARHVLGDKVETIDLG
ncbi:MAG TPA: AAA family ATPase [Aestuariivirgaceae bacterium]|nr:AAA family ATPase [Aestuariivirgaceae bacterium]